MQSDRKVALVTGATRGIGLETVRQLARRGLRVLLGARDLERGKARAAELTSEGLDVQAIRIDLEDEATIAAAARQIEQEHGRLDVLVNNAGIVVEGDGFPTKPSAAVLRKTMDTNFIGTVLVTQAMLPLLRRSPRGRIVNVSSTVGSLWWNADPQNPLPDNKWLGYAASKAAVNMLTVDLAYELRDTPIKVNAVCPGYVKTDLSPNGYLTVEEGARAPVHYGLLGDDGPSGGFFTVDGPQHW